MRDRLIGYLRGAWRRRWLGMGTAWLLCLIGWAAILLLPDQQISKAAQPAPPPAQAQPAQESPAQRLPASQDRAARLQSDLADALTLRDALARRLAGLPRALDNGRRDNPLHRRAAVQLGQQAALIAALQSQLVAERARIFELEQAKARPPGVERIPDDTETDHAASPVDRPDAPSGPDLTAPRRAIEPAGHIALLLGVLIFATATGTVSAVWRGSLDRIVDHTLQLQERFRPPVLGMISMPTSVEERRRARIAWIQLGLAGLALLVCCGGLATAEALDLLAPFGGRLDSSGLHATAGMIVGFHYSRRPIRRGSRASAPERAAGRLSSRDADPGTWRATREGAIATDSEATGDSREVPIETDLAAGAARVDRERLTVAGYLDPATCKPPLIEQLRPIARRVLAQAFAPAAGRRDRLVLVSSAGAGEGKSFTAINLALALSQDQDRAVLLIDADPGTAGSARALGLLPEPGLTDAFGEGAALEALISPTGLDNLEFLAPGRPSAALAGLFASRRMAQLVRELLARDLQGLVVIDGPPLLTGTAGAGLAMFAGQVIVAVAAGRTSEHALDASLRSLGERRCVGLVFTRAGRLPADRKDAGRRAG